MLRLTTLPIPQHPGTLSTVEISYRDAVQSIAATRDVVSHIGFQDVHEAVERSVGRSIELKGRAMPAPVDGDEYLTIRKRVPGDSLATAKWFLTRYRVYG
jgi:hypothetical protein